MHSCNECAFLKQAVLSCIGIKLSTLVKNGQREIPCPFLAILHQSIMLYEGKWGVLNEERQVDVSVLFRITKDGVLEGDIAKVWEVFPMRLAIVEFFVLPGRFDILILLPQSIVTLG